MTRDVRRAHRERLMKKRKNYHGGAYKDRLPKLVDTPKPCSCWMCCNRRRTEGPPISELRCNNPEE